MRQRAGDFNGHSGYRLGQWRIPGSVAFLRSLGSSGGSHEIDHGVRVSRRSGAPAGLICDFLLGESRQWPLWNEWVVRTCFRMRRCVGSEACMGGALPHEALPAGVDPAGGREARESARLGLSTLSVCQEWREVFLEWLTPAWPGAPGPPPGPPHPAQAQAQARGHAGSGAGTPPGTPT